MSNYVIFLESTITKIASTKDGRKTRKSKRTSKIVNREANLDLKMNWVKMEEQSKAKKKKEDARVRAQKMREKKKTSEQ